MSKETKVTAVEWLVNEINARGPKENNPPKWLKELYEQAKALEKQQIIDAYSADRFPCSDEDAEQYYTETYKP
jgi:hypothetical protein